MKFINDEREENEVIPAILGERDERREKGTPKWRETVQDDLIASEKLEFFTISKSTALKAARCIKAWDWPFHNLEKYTSKPCAGLQVS